MSQFQSNRADPRDFQSTHAPMDPSKDFNNQFNNLKYLEHPEKSYRHEILNQIFGSRPQPAAASTQRSQAGSQYSSRSKVIKYRHF